MPYFNLNLKVKEFKTNSDILRLVIGLTPEQYLSIKTLRFGYADDVTNIELI